MKRAIWWRIIQKNNGMLKGLSLWKDAITVLLNWDFMAKAPTDVEDLWRFIDEIPYGTAEKHGKKYRLMYRVYTHPKYRD